MFLFRRVAFCEKIEAKCESQYRFCFDIRWNIFLNYLEVEMRVALQAKSA